MKNQSVDKIGDSVAKAKKDQVIMKGLAEIYHDDEGKLIDVKKLEIKKAPGWRWWLMMVGMALVLLWGGYALFKHFLKQGVSTDAVTVNISLDHQPVAGEEFALVVDYTNNNQLEITDAELHLVYPQELIYLSSLPAPLENNNTWSVGSLPAGASGQIRIKARLISDLTKNSLVMGELRYRLQGFSTEYKKSADLNLALGDLGLDIEIVSPDSVLVGERQKLVVKYKGRKPYLDNFRLVVEPSNPNNLEFINDAQKNPDLTLVKPWVWQVNKLIDGPQEIVIYYKVIDKLEAKQIFNFKFSYLLGVTGAEATTIASGTQQIEISRPTEVFYPFKEEGLELELVKNSLNLLVLVNGSDKDQGVDFGQTLNYSLSYDNKGETALNDLSVTAVMEGDLVDWASLKDKNRGIIKGNTITWSPEQIPALASLAKGASGAIDFSLKLKEAGSGAKSEQVRSYAQFQTGVGTDLASLVKMIKEREEGAEAGGDGQAETALASLTDNNRSNTIISRVNSDFQLSQRVLYFNDDNIPVGSGPLPLEVDKETGLRVYWKLKNSFHDLEGVRVAVKLPEYAQWQDRLVTTVGNLRYDPASRQVIWEIPQLARNNSEIQAEFSLNFKPLASQRNKIIVLLPVVEAQATDTVTKGSIKRSASVKTSKLEDDSVVQSVNLDAASGLIK
jgi:putative component of toxin-antitoxin plasmid stabilization module